MKRMFFSLLPALWLLSAVASARAEAPVNTNGSSYAIGGYDLVAYVTDHAPAKGKPEHAVKNGGATYLFASAEHKMAFEKAPARYLPAYGGYCAYAVANGKLASIDPKAWTVRDGRLYLNYSLDIRAKWLEKAASYIDAANRNWPKITGKH